MDKRGILVAQAVVIGAMDVSHEELTFLLIVIRFESNRTAGNKRTGMNKFLAVFRHPVGIIKMRQQVPVDIARCLFYIQQHIINLPGRIFKGVFCIMVGFLRHCLTRKSKHDKEGYG